MKGKPKMKIIRFMSSIDIKLLVLRLYHLIYRGGSSFHTAVPLNSKNFYLSIHNSEEWIRNLPIEKQDESMLFDVALGEFSVMETLPMNGEHEIAIRLPRDHNRRIRILITKEGELYTLSITNKNGVFENKYHKLDKQSGDSKEE
jgi:hypothetical protein